jgi:uncharacterized protein (TIGR02246 family)
MSERPDPNLVLEYETEIRAIEARYDEAWNRADPDTLVADLADDAVVVNPRGEAATGRNAFRSIIAEMFSGPFAGSRHESTIHRIQFIAENVAVVDGEARVTRATPRTDVVHAFTDVFVRRGGKWEIAAVRAYVHVPLGERLP